MRRLFAATALFGLLLALGGLLWKGKQAGAFCNDWELFGVDLHCDGDGHTRVTNFIRPRDAGLATGMVAILDAVERRVAAGDIPGAIRDLKLLRARVDGCGSTADHNDWIADCAAQLQVRAFIDLLIANLS